MMDSDKILFEKGCFLPSWIEDTTSQEPKVISEVHTARNKDLATLLSELDDIKKHIEDVRERQWLLARKMQFHYNNLVKE